MDEQIYSLLDSHFGAFLASRSGLDGDDKFRFQEIVKKLSSALEGGHSCLPVTSSETKLLKKNLLVSSGEQTPLVLRNDKLYLHRYYCYETRLARQVGKLASISFPQNGDEELLATYFENSDTGCDWQREAAKVALSKALTIICGGPGTGKTTTVVKILCLLLEKEGDGLEIALAAPTGKAAMRLSESIGNSLGKMELSVKVKTGIPVEASTLHRLLGVKRNTPQFKHNAENPMNWDVVIVDEASMVDLAMMSKLVDALKPGARLILLGDKDQLASVESGAVLGDCIKSLPENTVELLKTFRFDNDIKELAECINQADGEGAWRALTEQKGQASNVSILSRGNLHYIAERYAALMEKVSRDGQDVAGIFTALHGFQVLCGGRRGKFGVQGLNRLVELSLARRGFDCRENSWYPGRPVMVRRNDYALDLYNGDIGICLLDPDGKTMKVWFERSNGRFKSYPPYMLPTCQTVFAMTIHKSQGSEFEEVVVVLPEVDSRMLSRELIYTAVTRAKKIVKIVAEKELLKMALSRNIERFSGLADLLQERGQKDLTDK